MSGGEGTEGRNSVIPAQEKLKDWRVLCGGICSRETDFSPK